MASSGFGLMPGNNAPTPIFGSTNPTGGNHNIFGSSAGSMPNFSLFGSNNPLTSPYSTSNPMSNMGSGFGLLPGGQQYGPTTYNDLGKMYGKGFGQYIGDIFSQGLFNPNVAQQYINFMQPQVQRGEGSILQAFGAEGNRFGSAAALGLGDYMSQVNLNEGEIFANMFQQSQQEQLGLLENILPTLHGEKANKGGWLSDLTSILGMIPGIGSAVKGIGGMFGMGGGGSNTGMVNSTGTGWADEASMGSDWSSMEGSAASALAGLL